MRLLPSVQFAYNNSIHSATGKTPIELTRRYTPTIRKQIAGVPPVERGENEHTKEHAHALQEGEAEAREIWRHANESAAKYYNKKHQQKIYTIRDRVILSLRYIRIQRASKKLTNKYLGPFTITKKFG